MSMWVGRALAIAQQMSSQGEGKTWGALGIGLFAYYFMYYSASYVIMNSMKLVIPLHLLHWSIHTKDESKRGTAFAFIFGVN